MTTNITKLQIQIFSRRGALIRAIGAIERRGFAVDRILCDGDQLECQVKATQRGLSALLNQLRKLEDVRGVRLVTS